MWGERKDWAEMHLQKEMAVHRCFLRSPASLAQQEHARQDSPVISDATEYRTL